ncbi:MAG: S-ribosylhomocysteine lyase [Spirochaetia bacterium]
MKKIASFTVDHEKLIRGVYLSRLDKFGDIALSSFDIRMREPNREPVMDNPNIHALEHLGATFLRNHPTWGPRIVYYGPMGCRTGFYLILEGNYTSTDIIELMKELFKFSMDFSGPIPGQSPIECGNYQDMNLSMAKWEAKKFYTEILSNISRENLEYPE